LHDRRTFSLNAALWKAFMADVSRQLDAEDPNFRMARYPGTDNRSLKHRLQFQRRRHFRVTALYADYADAYRAVQLSPGAIRQDHSDPERSGRSAHNRWIPR